MTTHSVHHAAHYDDDGHFNYLQFWTGRNCEHAAEVMAVRKLLHGLTFEHAIDVGGGGRLCRIISEFAEHVSLADSSRQQQVDDSSADLVTMIGVLHHLPDPTPELRELHRILRPSGLALIEVARKLDGVPFVNHHPVLLIGQLRAIGLRLERVLSVSNLRHRALIKSVPKPASIAAECALRERLAPLYFGPSIFMLLRKPIGTASADEGSASEYSADRRAGLAAGVC